MNQNLCTMLGLLSFAFQCSGERDVNAAGIVDKSINIDEKNFTRERIAEIASEFLKSHTGKFKVLRLTIGTDRFETQRSLGSAPVDANCYEYARMLNQKYGWPSKPIARLVAIGKDAVLNVRGRRENYNEVLQGSDPTLIRVAGTAYRLLHFQLWIPPAHLAGMAPELTLFFQTESRVSKQATQAFALGVRSKISFERMSISVKNDSWYFAESYPDVYRFGGPTRFPTSEEVMKSPVITCDLRGPKVTCVGP